MLAWTYITVLYNMRVFEAVLDLTMKVTLIHCERGHAPAVVVFYSFK